MKKAVDGTDSDPVDGPGHIDLITKIENNDTSVTVADLSQARLELDDFKRLARALANHPDTSPLQILNLSGNTINDECCNAIASSLTNLKFLQTLNLTGTSLSASCAKTILGYLLTNTGIKRLDLSENFLGDEGLHHVKKLIVQNKAVRELSIRSNYITQKGADDLVSFVGGINELVIEKIDMRDNVSITATKISLKCGKCTIILKDPPPSCCTLL